MDRRVANTRAKLQEALWQLLQERKYGAVTVEDICSRAGVGRSTFYSHFRDKAELTHSPMKALRRQFPAVALQTDQELRFAFTQPMLQHAKENLTLYRSLVSHGGSEAAFPEMRKMLAERIDAELAGRKLEGPLSRLPRGQLAKAVANTFFALMTGWLDGGAREPEAEVDAAFHALLRMGATRNTA